MHFAVTGLQIVEDGVTIISNKKGRNSGDAFVQFATKEMADKALERDREVMGNRCVNHEFIMQNVQYVYMFDKRSCCNFCTVVSECETYVYTFGNTFNQCDLHNSLCTFEQYVESVASYYC